MTSQPKDFDPYKIENVPLFEAIYGKHSISLGGTSAIDNMFSGVEFDLHKIKALDLGFGLGGVAYYLAKTYQMEITGIEIYPWMVKYAKDHTTQNIRHLLKFAVYEPQGKMPFEPLSFDMVYSKGVLNHVRDKKSLFKDVNALLKPEGRFIIADWIYPKTIIDDSGPMVYETQKTYQAVLENCGFSAIEFRDDSKVFISYVQLFLENLVTQRDFIEYKFDKALFTTLKNQHLNLIQDITAKRKFAVRIIAEK